MEIALQSKLDYTCKSYTSSLHEILLSTEIALQNGVPFSQKCTGEDNINLNQNLNTHIVE